MRLLLPTPAAPWPQQARGRKSPPHGHKKGTMNTHKKGRAREEDRVNTDPGHLRTLPTTAAQHHPLGPSSPASVACKMGHNGHIERPLSPPSFPSHQHPHPVDTQHTVTDKDQAHAVLHDESQGVCCGSVASRKAAARLSQLSQKVPAATARERARNCRQQGRAGRGGAASRGTAARAAQTRRRCPARPVLLQRGVPRHHVSQASAHPPRGRWLLAVLPPADAVGTASQLGAANIATWLIGSVVSSPSAHGDWLSRNVRDGGPPFDRLVAQSWESGVPSMHRVAYPMQKHWRETTV